MEQDNSLTLKENIKTKINYINNFNFEFLTDQVTIKRKLKLVSYKPETSKKRYYQITDNSYHSFFDSYPFYQDKKAINFLLDGYIQCLNDLSKKL